jgi:hypothetical protein
LRGLRETSLLRRERSTTLSKFTRRYSVREILSCCVDEFSNFSKNFMNKAPKPKSDLQDFLSMFEQQKMDPILLEELKEEEEDTIVVHEFLTFEKDNVLKTEAYYVTKHSQIKGFLLIKPGILHFEPVDSEENEIVISIISLITW